MSELKKNMQLLVVQLEHEMRLIDDAEQKKSRKKQSLQLFQSH